MKKDEPLKCSFCGKSQKQVLKLIAGPGVYICDECVELCNEIIGEELEEPFEGRWRSFSEDPDLMQRVAGLPEIERRTIELRLGLHDGRARTIREIGDELGLSRESARKIEVRALARLRVVSQPSAETLLEDYLDDQVRRYPRLDPSEERELLAHARAGDRAARKRVIQSYLELSALLALKLAPDFGSPIDAIQQANLALTALIDDAGVSEIAPRLSDAIREALSRHEPSSP